MKKLLSVFLILIMLLSLVPMTLASEEHAEPESMEEIVEEPEPAEPEPVREELPGEPDAEPEEPAEEPADEPAEEPATDGAKSGKCGDNVNWSLSGSTLTISGTGDMYNYDALSYPWRDDHSSIKTIIIENGVTSISNLAFTEFTALTSVTIPNSVKKIGAKAFIACEALKNVTLPSAVASIGWGAFSSCTSLTGINLPEGMKEIEDELFRDCTSLTSISIPGSITGIGERAFGGCTALNEFKVSASSESFKTIDGVLFTKDGKTLVCYPPAKTYTAYSIPSGVTSIDAWAFEDCTVLINVTIPESVTEIGSYTFTTCTSLKSVNIPNGVTQLPNGVFYGCASLNNILLPSGMTSIGSSAFQKCSSLMSVTVPASVASIGGWAFMDCPKLESVTFLGDAPHYWGYSVFLNTTTTVFYPSGNSTWTADTMQNYSGTITWKPYEPMQPLPLDRIDFASLETELIPGEEFPQKNGVPAADSHFTNPIYYWEDARGDVASGLPEPNKYYWLNVFVESDAGYTFGVAGTTVPVYVNGTKVGDGIVKADVYGRAEMVQLTLRRTGPYAPITAASITVTDPEAGKMPQSDAKPVSGSHFAIEEGYWCTSFTPSARLTSEFVYGTTYYYYAVLIPDAGYEFAGSAQGSVSEDELSVTANGMEAYSRYKSADGRVTVYFPFKAGGPVYSGVIELKGFVRPVVGAPTDQSAVTAVGSAYTITKQEWSLNAVFGGQASDTTFRDGKTYFWKCTVKLKDGKGFPEDYAAGLTIDGKKIPKMTTAEILVAVWNEESFTGGWDVNNDTMLITLAYTPTNTLLGDADGDGTVNKYDAALILQYLVGKVQASDLDMDAADTDGDGNVTAADAALIL